MIQPSKFKTLHNNQNIFYCNTEEVNSFLNNKIANEFILISGNSDGKIFDLGNYYPHANSLSIPDNLKHWYGQNVCVYNDKITSIPIGLEDDKWFPQLNKKNKIIQKTQEPKNHRNLIYLNHNINTNPKERSIPYKLFENKSFAKCVFGANGQDFDNYLDELYNSKFVICPEGNGTDTHRTWECLYLNTIPIEKRNINNSFYTDLPICFIDSWEEITEDFLNSEFDRITNQNWDLSKLDFNYWSKTIRGKL